MEIFSIRNLNFTYPEMEKPALKDINFSVQSGEMITLCGKSGSGKTTLLRLLKPSLEPHGQLDGSIAWQTNEPDMAVGFVLQNPENQIVTDKVWHELAFGPENLGWDTQTIRVRVAEMASYFGIQNWFRKNVNELSGGQKQMLNLAAVMVMKPKVLLLDEPTAQLDPITAGAFIDTVRKINDETGVTVILTEHRLDTVLPLSDRMLVLDQGRLIVDDTPEKGAAVLAEEGHPMFRSMPAPVQVYGQVCGRFSDSSGVLDPKISVDRDECFPVSIRQGRKWLEKLLEGKPISTAQLPSRKRPADGPVLLKMKNVWFRYDKHGEDVIRGLDVEIHQGEIFAVLGGNGTGKSTMLKLLAGIKKPDRGRIVRSCGRILMLPQDPQSVFASESVLGELAEMTDSEQKIRETAELMEIDKLLQMHPYDLSGGEQQRTALAKLLLADPDVILLDEPTKGMDNAFKDTLGHSFIQLKGQGKTIVLVSHDVEFCGRYADRCAMFFDGNITTAGPSDIFFAGNSFYTTAANRMSAEFFYNAVTPEDLAELIRLNLSPDSREEQI